MAVATEPSHIARRIADHAITHGFDGARDWAPADPRADGGPATTAPVHTFRCVYARSSQGRATMLVWHVHNQLDAVMRGGKPRHVVPAAHVLPAEPNRQQRRVKNVLAAQRDLLNSAMRRSGGCA